MMALDDARESFAFGRSLDIDHLSGRENVRRQSRARLQIRQRRFVAGADAKLAQHARGARFVLGQMPGQGAGKALVFARAESDLRGRVAVDGRGFDLRDAVAADIDNRDRARIAVVAEDARHAQFDAEQHRAGEMRRFDGDAFRGHQFSTFTSAWTPGGKSKRINSLLVLLVKSTMSSIRICSRNSIFSREVLSLCGERNKS